MTRRAVHPPAQLTGGAVGSMVKGVVRAMEAWIVRILACVVLASSGWLPRAAEEPAPITPTKAIKKVGEKVTVEMKVRAAKNRLEKRGEVYLDSEEDFKDPKNLGVVITRAGAAKFKESGVGDPAEHFLGKTIRATGKVTLVEKRPRIEVDDPKQIRTVKKKE
jgi:DNA/RNA endonuclease YhcR with UshA esterase domain